MMRFFKLYFSYESEFTGFLNQLKRDHPDLSAQQKAGRALFWDKETIDLDKTNRDRASQVKRGAYAYR